MLWLSYGFLALLTALLLYREVVDREYYADSSLVWGPLMAVLVTKQTYDAMRV